MGLPSPGSTTSPTWTNPQTLPRLMRSLVVGQVLPGDYATQTHAAAVVTYAAAGIGVAHSIAGVSWSYSAGTLAGGALTIADGSNTVFSVDIVNEGPGSIQFNTPLIGTPNQQMVITLADGSASVVGKLTVLGHTLVSGESVLFGVDFSSPANSGYVAIL